MHLRSVVVGLPKIRSKPTLMKLYKQGEASSFENNNTQERKSTKARARATLLNGLMPKLALEEELGEM